VIDVNDALRFGRDKSINVAGVRHRLAYFGLVAGTLCRTVTWTSAKSMLAVEAFQTTALENCQECRRIESQVGRGNLRSRTLDSSDLEPCVETDTVKLMFHSAEIEPFGKLEAPAAKCLAF
jgi:hypothetical protein